MQQTLADITEVHPAISWQGRLVANTLRTFIKPVAGKIRLSRRVMKFSQLGFDTVTLALPVHPDVHIAPANVGGVPGEWLMAGRKVLSGRVLLYLHGGGYFFGSPRSHRAVTWRLSRACRAKVLALDYRQPPDWHYPAPLTDAVSAYRSLLEQGYKAENIVIAGDSAGGNLTLVTLLALREKGLPLPAAGVLISPWGDLTCGGESMTSNAQDEPLIPIKMLRFLARFYSKGHDPASPMLSPVYADLSGLPPLMIQVGSTEVLLSDARRIAENALAAGVSCRLQEWQDMIHVFQVLASWVPEAALAVQEIGAFVNEQIRMAGGESQVRHCAKVVTGSG